MSKRVKIILSVLGFFVAVSVFHLWQNVGFEKLGLGSKESAEETKFRVGFLPVT